MIHLPVTQEIAGSSPARVAKAKMNNQLHSLFGHCIIGYLLHLLWRYSSVVEHAAVNRAVVGSSPIAASMIRRHG